VFLAEADAIDRELNGKAPDLELLSQTTKKRRVSDITTVFVACLIGIFVSLLLFYFEII
jgi:hypothetical protein